MYLISAYFDEKTNRIFSGWIERIAAKTGNSFMSENHVPPHLTLVSVEARSGELLIPVMKKWEGHWSAGNIFFVSVGAFFPYVLFCTPVLNEYLQQLSFRLHQSFSSLPEVKPGRFYRPMNWLPHVTLGKTLSKSQIRTAFEIMQETFVPFEGRIVSIGLAKVNPHEDLLKIELQSGFTKKPEAPDSLEPPIDL